MVLIVALAVLPGLALLVMLAIALWNAAAFPRLRPVRRLPGIVQPNDAALPAAFRGGVSGTAPIGDGELVLYGQGTPCPYTANADGSNDPFGESATAGGRGDVPFVSLLVPARDEAAVIGATVERLLAQRYPRFEVLVLDDHSSDGTGELARAAADGDDRLRVLQGAPLPPGWLGKNWACQQLADAARGDWLVFTDADVRWSPDALAALLAEAEQSDVATVWPTQITVTWGERLVVPLMALVILAYLPAALVHRTPWASFAAANGQCLAFRRRAYDAVGGHAAVRASIVEDIALARRAKSCGLRLRMADGAGLIACRMYDGWASVRDGYAKNIIAGYGDSVAFLALATVFHWWLFLWPWLWLLLGWAFPVLTGWPWLPLALAALGVALRGLTAALTRQRVADALLMPVSVLAMTAIAAQAVWWRWHGGPRWKGRALAPAVTK